MAASSIVQTVASNGDNWKVIKFDCTACTTGGSEGTFTAVTTSSDINSVVRDWSLYKFQVVIGATAPTASSDFTVKDSFGVDLLGGQGTNKITGSAGDTVENYPKVNDQAANQPVISPLTLAISGNAVSGATFVIYLYFKRPGW